MPVTIKTDEELNLMRKAGELLAQVHEELHDALRPGVSTLELDAIGEEAIRKRGGIPNCKDYEGYPASV
jgi:methionyl aminopeptidase